MTKVGRNAKNTTLPACFALKGMTANSACIGGRKSTMESRSVPMKKAARQNGLLKMPARKMLRLLRQLKPWNSLESVSVENAIVQAQAELAVSPAW